MMELHTSARRFALVDVNAMYASCERVFRPDLNGKPVVVLSNNDGCVVTRSAEVKVLGIPMGIPWYQIQELAQKHGIVAFSSNYELYADMSNRFVDVLSQFSADIEVYSIDEAFLGLWGMQCEGSAYGREIRQRIRQWTGLPVCVGIGSTKTRAKLANHVAKKDGAWGGVCDLEACAPDEQDELLGRIEVGDVWGVGPRLRKRLASCGIATARDLRDADPAAIRKTYSVILERTVRELRGQSCLDLEHVRPVKQEIMSSRSFGKGITALEELQEAVATYASRAAEKLRKDGSRAGAVRVHIMTNQFRLDQPQYGRSHIVTLGEPTDDTAALITAALRALQQIYRPGYTYIKAGTLLMDLVPRGHETRLLFADDEERERRSALMKVMDGINLQWGRNSLGVGVAAFRGGRSWTMKRGSKSPNYTTSWKQLPVAHA